MEILQTIKNSLFFIKDNALKYWFYISAAVIGLLWYSLGRKEKQLARALEEAQAAILAQKLQKIVDKASNSQEDYEKAKKEYEDIKRRHADLFQRLQLGPVPPGPGPGSSEGT